MSLCDIGQGRNCCIPMIYFVNDIELSYRAEHVLCEFRLMTPESTVAKSAEHTAQEQVAVTC